MLTRRTKVWLMAVLVLLLAAVAGNCGGGKTPEANTNEGTAGAAWTPTGKEGTIKGTISFAGTVPEAKKIDTSADAACTSKSPNLMTEDSVVKDGKLANAFVYIKEGTIDGGGK